MAIGIILLLAVGLMPIFFADDHDSSSSYSAAPTVQELRGEPITSARFSDAALLSSNGSDTQCVSGTDVGSQLINDYRFDGEATLFVNQGRENALSDGWSEGKPLVLSGNRGYTQASATFTKVVNGHSFQLVIVAHELSSDGAQVRMYAAPIGSRSC